MDPHVDDRADADMTPAADDAAVEDDVRPTANERVDSATTSLDDVPVDRALPTDEVEESDNDDFDEEAMRATVVAWLDAKLPTTDLEGTNLKQLREWTVEACPGAVRLPDLKALVKKHVTTFIQNRPRPEASDSSDSNSSSDGASEMAEKKQQGRNQASRKSNGRGNKVRFLHRSELPVCLRACLPDCVGFVFFHESNRIESNRVSTVHSTPPSCLVPPMMCWYCQEYCRLAACCPERRRAVACSTLIESGK
jgi:ribulose bisphosphate carboxylase small subunit